MSAMVHYAWFTSLPADGLSCVCPLSPLMQCNNSTSKRGVVCAHTARLPSVAELSLVKATDSTEHDGQADGTDHDSSTESIDLCTSNVVCQRNQALVINMLINLKPVRVTD